MPVDTKSDAYEVAEPSWEKCRDVFEGDRAVKKAGTRYLPAIGDHQSNDAKYQAYLSRALFYNTFRRTVTGLTGQIFQKPPTVEFPSRLEKLLEDVTLSTKPFDRLAQEITEEVLTVGRVGCLVDMPAADAMDQRPYTVVYKAENIISWRTMRRGGEDVLSQVVLREFVERIDPKDQFVTKTEEQYRVLALEETGYTQTLYVKDESASTPDKLVPQMPVVPLRRGDALDFIPFVFFGPTSIGVDIERAPLEDLVDVNLSHYRGYADLKHGLHYTALVTPVVIGSKQGDAPLSIGSGVAWHLAEGSSAMMLEVSGAGLGAIRLDLQDMEKMMGTLGARLLEGQSAVQETAHAVQMRHAGQHATLATIAQSVEQGLTFVLQWLAWWSGTEKTPADTGAEVELNKDFFASKLSAQDLQALMHAYQASAMSWETLYHNWQQGELTRPGITAEEEMRAILADEPASREPEPIPAAVPAVVVEQ